MPAAAGRWTRGRKRRGSQTAREAPPFLPEGRCVHIGNALIVEGLDGHTVRQ